MAPGAKLEKKLEGLVAATFTPLTNAGEINTSEIEPYVDYLLQRQNVRNVFVNGTTGEGMSLSVQERKNLAEVWCERAKGKLDNVIIHVGCTSLRDSQELAAHAADKADAIAVISPSFYKPGSAKALQLYLKEVADAAPNVPFYYYHIPAVTGVNVLAQDVLNGIETLIPTFRGVKFSGTDLMDLGRCVSYGHSRDWSVLYGVDEQLLGGLVLGADGAVGSTYNYLGCHANRLFADFGTGNLLSAREIQFKMQELLTYAVGLGFDLGVNKQLMIELSGLSLGPPRLPVMPCPSNIAERIARKYRSIFDSC